jgi:hypothetical protein
VQSPRPSFRAGQLGHDGASDHLKSITHARQEPIELLIAQLDLSGKELTDAGLMHTADTGQLRLSGARFQHHLTEQTTTAGDTQTIACPAMDRSTADDRSTSSRWRFGNRLATPEPKTAQYGQQHQRIKIGAHLRFRRIPIMPNHRPLALRRREREFESRRGRQPKSGADQGKHWRVVVIDQDKDAARPCTDRDSSEIGLIHGLDQPACGRAESPQTWIGTRVGGGRTEAESVRRPGTV